MTTPNKPINVEALIIGAGPVGLFAVFELGLLGIKAHVVDVLPKIGGQCAELYPHKPIYDIPGIPGCTGTQLIDGLLEQIKPFDAQFHLGQQVIDIHHAEEREEDYVTDQPYTFVVKTSAGQTLLAQTVIIAAGMGSFEPIRLKTNASTACEGKSLHYSVKDPADFKGRNLAILGGGDSALDWALALADIEAETSVVHIHRSTDFKAAPASVAQMRQKEANLELQHITGQVTELLHDNGQIYQIKVKCADGVTRAVDCDHVLAFFGLIPNLGTMPEWGFEVVHGRVPVDTEKFQTDVKGVFAIGDINIYPGKKKLILSGFHEAALAAYGAYEFIKGRPATFQFTTTSTTVHDRLGVSPDLSGL